MGRLKCWERAWGKEKVELQKGIWDSWGHLLGDGGSSREGQEDSQVPSLSSSSSTWSLRDSILSLRPHSSATFSGCSSSGGMGSTARTQAPA